MSVPYYFPTDLLAFHRPRQQLRKYVTQIPVLKQESRRSVRVQRIPRRGLTSPDRCIRALANYTPRRRNVKYPRERHAAVLVALFVGREGDLYVLLSRCATHRARSSHLVTTIQTGIRPTDLCRRYRLARWKGRRKRQEPGRDSSKCFQAPPRLRLTDLHSEEKRSKRSQSFKRSCRSSYD